MSVMAIFCKYIAPGVGDFFPVGAAFRGKVPAEYPAKGSIVYTNQAGQGFVQDVAGMSGLEIAVEGLAAADFSKETSEEFISFLGFHSSLNSFFAAKIRFKTDNFCQVWEITGKILSFV